MTSTRLLLASPLVLLAAACASEQRPGPAPTQTARPVARPVATAAPAPIADWRDAPLTPGGWSYAAGPAGSSASFGQPGAPLLWLRCERAQGTVALLRAGAAAGPEALTITTSDGTRPFSAAPEAGPPAALVVRFPARDPLLDSLAFSRGRFAVEAHGLAPLYVPSWAEIGRVVEDCR